jgi:hypothetical protein
MLQSLVSLLLTVSKTQGKHTTLCEILTKEELFFPLDYFNSCYKHFNSYVTNPSNCTIHSALFTFCHLQVSAYSQACRISRNSCSIHTRCEINFLCILVGHNCLIVYLRNTCTSVKSSVRLKILSVLNTVFFLPTLQLQLQTRVEICADVYSNYGANIPRCCVQTTLSAILTLAVQI